MRTSAASSSSSANFSEALPPQGPTHTPHSTPQVPGRSSSLQQKAHRYSRSWASSRPSTAQTCPPTPPPKDKLDDAGNETQKAGLAHIISCARSRTRPSTAESSGPIPNFSRRLSSAHSMDNRGYKSGTLSNSKRTKIRRWNGISKHVSHWDGLRRDSELWMENANCFVHLYEKGHSRRGPSFCIPLTSLKALKCGKMFSVCFAQRKGGVYEIFIPAPEDAMREEAFAWHITTRNFFAFVMRKSLVGTHLSQSLIKLRERLDLFRADGVNNEEDFMAYLDELGYLDFGHSQDHALAILNYAEHFQLYDLWIDAFAHCVGMNDTLATSSEFESVPRVTKALITRAYLEMDLHLERVAKAMSNFLEDDLSAAYLGLSQGARAHLDRFRTFLHTYYVEKFGYWPPPKGSQFPKSLYKSMYFDFRNLYDFLVDTTSSEALELQRPATGGICVLQNVQAFDQRHKYTALPHPLPLEPNAPPEPSKRQSRGFSMMFGSKQSKTDRYMSVRASLSAATNTGDVEVMSSHLVRAYKRFEAEWSSRQEEKVSVVDARKVRWLLIYGIVQMLISIIRAPKEVRDTDGPSYALCCLVPDSPPWESGIEALKMQIFAPLDQSTPAHEMSSRPGTAGSIMPDKPLPTTPTYSIQPDCESDDYFAPKSPAGATTPPRGLLSDVPAPLRINSSHSNAPPIARNTSLRSIKALSTAFSSRRTSVVVKKQQSPFCEILVQGYGNGLNQTTVDEPDRTGTFTYPETAAGEIVQPKPQRPQTWNVGAGKYSGISDVKKKSKKVINNLTVHAAASLENMRSRTPVLEAEEFEQTYVPSNAERKNHLQLPEPTIPRSGNAAPASTPLLLTPDESPSSESSTLAPPLWSSAASTSSASSVPELDPSSPNDSNRSSGVSITSPVDGDAPSHDIWSDLKTTPATTETALGANANQVILVERSFSVVHHRAEAPVAGKVVRDYATPIAEPESKAAGGLKPCLAHSGSMTKKADKRRSFRVKMRDELEIFSSGLSRNNSITT
ncbi:hypothetical protein K402DRAFT_416470 [Aulographum hederae CBS 113979]|uniref:DUF8004 domain-containing protein n=1 Tax=Aulographum hederae CBS 113979 TaxID=1176131 RepID=A0A6G1HFL8_9PEZI|nr:hypothetical protein K402DRAFT_416470 [Aulographum hederae CBS 113979]